MTVPRRSFQDIAEKRFTVPDAFKAKTIDEIVTRVPTTRSNLNKVLHYFSGAGIRII